jgi:hypothetical protein
VGNEGRWLIVAGGMGRGDKLRCVGPGARRDWCVTERGCHWGTVASVGTRASPMCNGIWVFTLGDAARVNLTLGCGMGDATLGDAGHTLGVS